MAHPRVGIVVPKRRRVTADRNRLKRRLRELVRLHILYALPPLDLVIYARAEAYEASFQDLRQDVLRAVHRAADVTRQVNEAVE